MNTPLSPQALTAIGRLARGLSQELHQTVRLADPQAVATLLRLSRDIDNPDLQCLRADVVRSLRAARVERGSSRH